MSRIRVLRVIARMNVGGPARQVTTLIEGLDESRFDHVVLAGSVEEGEADFLSLRAPHLAIRRIDGLGRSIRAGSDAAALAHLVGEMRRFRPDIVHTHTAKAGVLGRFAAIATRVPLLVHTFHGHLLHGYFSPSVTRGVISVERLLARRTSSLVAVGEQVRDDLLEARVGRPEQYSVVPPGITVGPVPPQAQARAALGLALDVPVVAFVARLTGVKRPDRFADVARAVAAARPDVVFAVAGEGPLLMELRGSVQDLSPNVSFLGWRSDVETIYAASDLVLLTSDNEGMPVSLIEAALCGRAAVTTDVGSAREVVVDGATGRVVERNARQLTDAVLDLLSHANRTAMWGEVAQRRAREAFGPERLVRDTESLYERLIAARPR